MRKSRGGIAAIVAGVIATMAAPAHGADAAADYPNKSVRIVVPYPPGGSNDVIARVLAQKLTEQTGQAFIVDNRAGAGGNVGAELVARSEPDGYTLLLTAPPALTTNVFLYKKMPFDPAKAFAPVSLLATVPIVLVVHPSTGIGSVGALIERAKAKPGTLNFGSSGNGSTNHLAGELLKRRAGIDIVHVPYKGAAPALSDLLGGHIPMMFDNIPALMPHVRSGAVTAIGVAGSTRATALPDVPTVAEAGVDDFEASAWFGLVAPADTPPRVLSQLQQAVKDSLASPDVLKRLSELGAEPSSISGEAFGRFLAQESSKWGAIIEASGAKID